MLILEISPHPNTQKKTQTSYSLKLFSTLKKNNLAAADKKVAATAVVDSDNDASAAKEKGSGGDGEGTAGKSAVTESNVDAVASSDSATVKSSKKVATVVSKAKVVKIETEADGHDEDEDDDDDDENLVIATAASDDGTGEQVVANESDEIVDEEMLDFDEDAAALLLIDEDNLQLATEEDDEDDLLNEAVAQLESDDGAGGDDYRSKKPLRGSKRGYGRNKYIKLSCVHCRYQCLTFKVGVNVLYCEDIKKMFMNSPLRNMPIICTIVRIKKLCVALLFGKRLQLPVCVWHNVRSNVNWKNPRLTMPMLMLTLSFVCCAG